MPSTKRDEIAAELRRRVSQGSSPPLFEIRDLVALESWSGSISGRTRAKVLMSLIASDPTRDMGVALADAISALEDWDVALAEFLRNASITPAVVFAAARVAHTRELRVPWARLTEPPSYAEAVYEAVQDGDVIRFARSGADAKAGPCFIFGIENPLVHQGAGDLAFEGDDCLLSGVDEAWMEPGRLACPAFAIVVR